MFPSKTLIAFTLLAISSAAQGASLPASADRDIQVVRSHNITSIALRDTGLNVARDLAALEERNAQDALEPRAGRVTTLVTRSSHSVERATRAIRKWRKTKGKGATSQQELAAFNAALRKANKHLICAADRLVKIQKRDLQEDDDEDDDEDLEDDEAGPDLVRRIGGVPVPTVIPTVVPVPTVIETIVPVPTVIETIVPTAIETIVPTAIETLVPTAIETLVPTAIETLVPTAIETLVPTAIETLIPTDIPTALPTDILTVLPTDILTVLPTDILTVLPTDILTVLPTDILTVLPTDILTVLPTDIL
ncbi:unnamed protein product, partial [Tilletia laevis]